MHLACRDQLALCCVPEFVVSLARFNIFSAIQNRTFVISVRSGKTEWVDVRTGLTSGPLIEVFGDLKAGDEIAGRGTDELRPGVIVQSRQVKSVT